MGDEDNETIRVGETSEGVAAVRLWDGTGTRRFKWENGTILDQDRR